VTELCGRRELAVVVGGQEIIKCATPPIISPLPLLLLIRAMGDVVDSMLDLMRRLPPPRVAENVAALAALSPDHADELLGSVDQPLQVRVCAESGKEYLACDYNRDGESYRCAPPRAGVDGGVTAPQEPALERVRPAAGGRDGAGAGAPPARGRRERRVRDVPGAVLRRRAQLRVLVGPRRRRLRGRRAAQEECVPCRFYGGGG
jgi:hypothetical protein